jgi:hypothetical protein
MTPTAVLTVHSSTVLPLVRWALVLLALALALAPGRAAGMSWLAAANPPSLAVIGHSDGSLLASVTRAPALPPAEPPPGVPPALPSPGSDYALTRAGLLSA